MKWDPLTDGRIPRSCGKGRGSRRFLRMRRGRHADRMKKMGEMNMGNMRQAQKAAPAVPVTLVKCLLAAYLLTGAGLLLLALLLYRLQLSEGAVNIGIIVIYALSSLAAGFLCGKCVKDRRFFWGLICGVLYFCVLAVLTLAVNHSFRDLNTRFFTTLMICAGSGMLGGMIS